MTGRHTKQEIGQKYNDFASKYDLAEAIPELLGLRRLRKSLLSQAEGNVLEIAAGTGRNLQHYPTGCNITAIDLSEGMMGIARKKASDLGITVDFHYMDAEDLSFEQNSFDTVVDTLSACTFLDPVKALGEMARVCKPGGKILLLEHGRSNRGWLGQFQDWRADSHARQLGCVWNREPQDMVLEAGLLVISARRSFLGIFHTVVASPPTG